jgi:atypical dual specificity phosphatase
METCGTSLKGTLEHYYHEPIVDRETTSKAHHERILANMAKHIQRGDSVLVHCKGGRGRTPLVFYAFLMRHERLRMYEIEQRTRAQRETMLTAVQRTYLTEFEREAMQPRVHYEGEGQPSMIVFVGLPGSGKSTLSKHLVQHAPSLFVRVNQDEMGRKQCEKLVSDTIHGGSSTSQPTVVVDRCNPTREDRRQWLDSLKHHQKAWAIFMATPVEECVYRAEHRKGHETLRGARAGSIITALAHKLEPPTTAEGFAKVICLSNESEVAHLLGTWNVRDIEVPLEESLFKFPRMRHIYNFGGASRDDLLVSAADAVRGCLNRRIWVEEKIDGANLGFTIDPTSMRVLVQNRSHYVNSKYHRQFEKLDVWLAQHSNGLFSVLEPGRHTLFGEWVYMKHSIHYTRLPGYFVAFDMYDRLEKRFWARERLEAALRQTEIPLIAVVAHDTFTKVDELVRLVHTTSHYYDGPIEGVYIKCTDGQHVLFRGKIVRDDFLSGDTHWAKGHATKNLVASPSLTD